MATNDFDETQGYTTKDPGKGHKTAIVVLAVGLAAALAGDGYLISKSNHLTSDIASAPPVSFKRNTAASPPGPATVFVPTV